MSCFRNIKDNFVARFINYIAIFSILFSVCMVVDCFGEDANCWKIGGKIHFEEQSGRDYLGTLEINEETRNAIKDFFNVLLDTCSHNAKVVIKKENNDFIIKHYEERNIPGIGEEMHATLLYTSNRFSDGHETLQDIWGNLAQIDANVSYENAPTVEQVAKMYQKIIKPEWKFEISDVVFIRGKTGSGIIANLLYDGRDEIVNGDGHPVSGKFLHMTLAMVDESVVSEIEKINLVVLKLKAKLVGKLIKIGNRNGHADLEFGISGTKDRVRF